MSFFGEKARMPLKSKDAEKSETPTELLAQISGQMRTFLLQPSYAKNKRIRKQILILYSTS